MSPPTACCDARTLLVLILVCFQAGPAYGLHVQFVLRLKISPVQKTFVNSGLNERTRAWFKEVQSVNHGVYNTNGGSVDVGDSL